MRKRITLLMTLLVGSSISYGNKDGEVNFEFGYRNDDLTFKK